MFLASLLQAGAADVQGASSSAGVQLREQGRSSVPKDILNGNRAGASRTQEKESDRVIFLRDRCKGLEQQLFAAQAEVAVLKSKQKTAAEREEFLLQEVAKASEQLLCKQALQPPSPFVGSSLARMSFRFVCRS